ncbi:MAG: hypothetical protein PHE48_00055 [Candidatus Daviesbacteria bacterium]|nr:hypothetical protein [Candidatus Daviesbacteria bacterium]
MNIPKSKFLIIGIVAVLLVGGWLVYKNFPKSQVVQQTKQVVQEKVLSKDDLLKQRSTDYSVAFQYKDFSKVYDFLTPEDKKLISKDEYIKIQKEASQSSIKDFTIDLVEVNGDEGIVRTSLTYCLFGICTGAGQNNNIQTQKTTSRWIFIDGQWYRPAISENKELYGIK